MGQGKMKKTELEMTSCVFVVVVVVEVGFQRSFEGMGGLICDFFKVSIVSRRQSVRDSVLNGCQIHVSAYHEGKGYLRSPLLRTESYKRCLSLTNRVGWNIAMRISPTAKNSAFNNN